MKNNSTGDQVLEDAENQIREACEVLQREATRLRQQKAIPSRRHVGKNRALSSLVDCKPPCWRSPFYDKSSNADKRSRLDVSCDVLREVRGETIRRQSFLYRPKWETLPVYTQLSPHWEITFAKGATFLDELAEEAEFYQIQRILDELAFKAPEYFEESWILTNEEHRSVLNGWLSIRGQMEASIPRFT